MSERRPRPNAQATQRTTKRTPPRYNAVVASATVMKQRPPGMRAHVAKTADWQNEAWERYDENGELRFAVGWIANGLSQVNLVAARRPVSLGDDPTPLAGTTGIEADANALVSAIAGGPDGQAQLLSRLATLLTVPGIGWVLIEAPEDDGTSEPSESWVWRALSSDELRASRSGDGYEVEDVDSPRSEGGWRPLASDHVLIKVWRSHARRASMPDSSTRGAIRPLRQLSMLDDHIDATAQSRLAGAGLLVVPDEVEFVPVSRDPNEEADPDPDQPDGALEDDFTEVLIDTMTTPIADRASAAAVVPLTIKVPGEYVDKVKHITFWSEFSETVLGLSERAIKRTALALDMPPEVITGVSGMNHWGAWRVQEEAITLHIEPLSKVICEALTTGYFRPGLRAKGYSRVEVDVLLIHHDTTNLTVRPDLSDDALAAWDRMEVSSETMRREIGLSETDKPKDDEWRRRMIVRVIDRSPQLAPFLLPELGINVSLPPEGQPYPALPTETTPGRQIGGPPDSGGESGGPSTQDEPEAVAASADSRLSPALLAACDGLVHRALERAGAKLRNKAGRRDGGAASIECDDPAELHTMLDVSTFSNVHELLGGAWVRVPEIATRYGVNTDVLTTHLDSYTRGLLVNGQSHSIERLQDALPRSAATVG